MTYTYQFSYQLNSITLPKNVSQVSKFMMSIVFDAWINKNINKSDKISYMNGRVQWDPEPDFFSSDSKKNEPGVLQRTRAIQIGLKG